LKRDSAKKLLGEDHEGHRICVGGKLKTKFVKVVVCFYQWQDELPTGWPIEVIEG
jgi:hypothetical protein